MNKSDYKKKNKKRLQGVVVSDKTKSTRVVEVERRVHHLLYQKALKKRNKFYAHDEKEISKLGDTVIIEESRPLSKLKRWRVIEVK
jgi:small subunit ribosomal protein S17